MKNKISDFLTIDTEKRECKIIETGITFELKFIKSLNLKIIPTDKSIKTGVKVALENALSSTIASGSEKVDVVLEVRLLDLSNILIKFNDKPLIRGNMDYHETIRLARETEKELKLKS